jgi:cobyrinic acid a,c-diamide synthase
LGGFPKDKEHAFPERHLGLLTADERTLPDTFLQHWGLAAEEWLSLDRIVELARSAVQLELAPPTRGQATLAERCVIGIAYDAAFHFYYPDNLARLEARGAKIVRFSPISDAQLPDVDGVYLGGGYPEVHAAALSRNVAFQNDLREKVRAGLPLYAECGGLMYLTRAIRTLDGTLHPMLGLIDAEAHMRDRLQALGYVEVETTTRTILGEPGLRFRGHQFRYSELVDAQTPTLAYRLRKRRGNETSKEGFASNNVLASYVHAHWASNAKAAEGMVASAEAFRRARASSVTGSAP